MRQQEQESAGNIRYEQQDDQDLRHSPGGKSCATTTATRHASIVASRRDTSLRRRWSEISDL